LKLLFLCQVLPYPLDAGPKTRAYYVLRQLASTHEVTLACFSRPDDPEGAVDHLRAFCRAIHTVPLRRPRWRELLALGQAFRRRLPFSICRDGRAQMAALVAAVSARQAFSSVHIDQLSMAQYGLVAPVERRVLDAHNATWHLLRRLAEGESRRWLRPLLQREWQIMRRYEAAVCRRVDAVVAVSAEDRSRLIAAGAADSIDVVPICLEPGPDPEPAREVARQAAPQVAFIGGMHWPPNAAGIRWFVREVWPRVVAARPDARLAVIGRDPPSELRAMPLVTVHGYVENPEQILARSIALVVPLLAGGGMRVKILEAWARGLPVVTTTIGREGLAGRAGHELLVADAPALFAAAVIELLDRPERRAALTRSARRLLVDRYDWRREYGRFSRLHAPHGALVG
jgi:glycosyltransferase involved in cell wall biosynthesis